MKSPSYCHAVSSRQLPKRTARILRKRMKEIGCDMAQCLCRGFLNDGMVMVHKKGYKSSVMTLPEVTISAAISAIEKFAERT